MTENEIKELASVLEQARERAGNTAGSMNRGFGMWYAQELAKADYGKIPDGAVVLNIGENNEALDEKTIEFFVKHNAKVRKETAREIFEKLREKCMFDGYPYGVDYKEICETVKGYGVEVEE